MTRLFLILFFLISIKALSQTGDNADAAKEFKRLRALGYKAFNGKNYKLADSLYTQALYAFRGADVYYKRALCRKQMGDTIGYCKDLAESAYLGDLSAMKMYLKNCGKIDTIFQESDSSLFVSWQFFYKNSLIKTIDFNYQAVKSWSHNPNNLTYAHLAVSKVAEFPGGDSALKRFLKNNLVCPPSVMKNNIRAKCYVQILVHKDGTLSNFEVLKRVPDCSECDAEALRSAKLIPKLTPANICGYKVTSIYNLVIEFKK